MNLKNLKFIAMGFLLAFTLSACQDIKGLLGIQDQVIDFPPGEYIGKARLIGEKPSLAVNGTTANGTTAEVSVAPSTESTKKEEKVSEAKSELEAKPEVPTQGTELKPAEESAEQEGVLKEAPKLVDPLEKINGDKVSITFLPKDPGITDGIGVLMINDASHRFLWRTNGNNKDTWNVLFTKDNNIYSNLHSNFNFDGVLTVSMAENKLVGRLYIDNDSKISEYYVETYQFFKPKIIPPKEAITIKGGDDIVIDVEKAGEDPDQLVAILNGIPSEKQQASINELKVKNVEFDSKKGTYKVYIMTSKNLGKGEYSLYLIRSGSHKTNSIPVKI